MTARGRGQHGNAAGDDAFDGLAGFRVLDEGGVSDALLDLIAFGLRARSLGYGFVNVGGHGEVMSER